ELVAQPLELGEEAGKALPVGRTPVEAVAERRGVLIVEVLGHEGHGGVHVPRAQRLEVPGHDLGRAGRGHSEPSPQSSRTVEKTFWLWENSMTLPSGSLAAQM